LIERPEYVLSYHRDHGIPNWVSWQLTQQDLGDVERSDNFVPDTSLPAGWYQVKPDDYSGSGYDRGHICPSADRTDTKKANEATFIMTNMVPQAPDNNRVTWEHLESYSRDLVTKGHVLYIIAGGDGSNGTIAKGKVLVPGYTWKIIVVMPKGDSDVSHITADTPVIAVRVPNGLKDKLDDWDKYRVTVASIEEATGYDFFTNLAPNIQHALKSQAGMSSSEPVIETPLSTPTPKPSNSEAVCECGSNHYDCSDFETHKSAQACYEHCISLGRGDIHQLDGNNDGSVCESLP
jgi:endonuclease G